MSYFCSWVGLWITLHTQAINSRVEGNSTIEDLQKGERNHSATSGSQLWFVTDARTVALVVPCQVWRHFDEFWADGAWTQPLTHTGLLSINWLHSPKQYWHSASGPPKYFIFCPSILFFPFLLTISTTTPSNQKWNNSNYIWNLNREAGGFAMIWHGNKHLVWSSTSTPSPTTPFPHRMASLRLEDFVIPSKGPHITSMESLVLTLT